MRPSPIAFRKAKTDIWPPRRQDAKETLDLPSDSPLDL
jgi:hypothetical protein